jgi:chromosome segregation ATPase
VGCEKRLDKLRDPLNQHQTDLGAALIDAISSGRACGIDDLERRASIDREKEAALTREIETWQQTQSSVEARLPDLQNRVDWAKRIIPRKAADILRPAIEPAIAKLEKIRAEYESAHAQLAFLHVMAFADLPRSDEDRRVGRILNSLTLDCHHPSAAPWKDAWVALQRDPDAEIPA